MIKTENASYNKTTGGVLCKNCRKQIAVLHNAQMCLTLCAVCNCGEFCEIKIDKTKGAADACAINVDGSIICRKCGETLFDIDKTAVISFAFRANCGCGAVLEKAEEYSKTTRKLGEYAGLLEEE